MGLPSLNDRALLLAGELCERAGELGCAYRTVAGARVVDCGVSEMGSLRAGVYLARICLADLADVSLLPINLGELTLPGVQVNVHAPIAACMASQYAGWKISMGKYFAMGSGPMRAAYGHEKLYEEIGMKESPKVAVGVLESGELPGDDVIFKLAGDCHVQPARLTLLVARTASLAGGVQVVARSVETALHKLHELKFPISRIVAGFGTAPIPPIAKHDMAAIGRTNDAVLYGGQVTLYARGDDDAIAQVIAQLPSSASRDFGKPFYDLFKSVNYDFYKIDPLLFSPACIIINNVQTGHSFQAGRVHVDVLRQSFGL